MVTVLFITLGVLSSSILASVVVIYARRMTKETRMFWAYNIIFVMLRQFLSFVERLLKNKSTINSEDFFKYSNYCLSIFMAIFFIIYIHKRYSKEQNEINSCE